MPRQIITLWNDRLPRCSKSTCVSGDLYVLDFGGHCATDRARGEGNTNGP